MKATWILGITVMPLLKQGENYLARFLGNLIFSDDKRLTKNHYEKTKKKKTTRLLRISKAIKKMSYYEYLVVTCV